MSYSVAPSAISSLAQNLDSTNLVVQSMKNAIALKPFLASNAAGEATGNTALSPATGSLSTYGAAKALNPLGGMANHSDEELKKVSKNFESIFLRMLFKEMRNTVEKSSFLGHSQAVDFFEQMHDEQLSEQLSSAGGLGIGNMIYQKLREIVAPHQKTLG